MDQSGVRMDVRQHLHSIVCQRRLAQDFYTRRRRGQKSKAAVFGARSSPVRTAAISFV